MADIVKTGAIGEDVDIYLMHLSDQALSMVAYDHNMTHIAAALNALNNTTDLMQDDLSSQIRRLRDATPWTVKDEHVFATVTARDEWFTIHIEDMVEGLYIIVGTTFQRRLGNAWTDVTAIARGPKGEKGGQGQGLNVLGVLDSVNELPWIGNINGDAYIIDNHFWVWVADDWKNVGGVGGTPSVHVLVGTGPPPDPTELPINTIYIKIS